MHSSTFRDGTDLGGKDVLVVGVGNSALDIVRQLRHRLDHVRTCPSTHVRPHPAVCRPLLRARAYQMLISACNPMLRLIHGDLVTSSGAHRAQEQRGIDPGGVQASGGDPTRLVFRLWQARRHVFQHPGVHGRPQIPARVRALSPNPTANLCTRKGGQREREGERDRKKRRGGRRRRKKKKEKKNTALAVECVIQPRTARLPVFDILCPARSLLHVRMV